MIKNTISVIFRLSVAVFLLGGLTIVAVQAAGLIVGDGDLVTAVTDNVAPWVYGSAGIAGLLAFALSYFSHHQGAAEVTSDGAGDQNNSPPVHEHA